MDIHRLEVFCKVVELKSFTRAGEACSLSQPTVSEHIRGLETLLGHKLLERIKGGVQPTPVAGSSTSTLAPSFRLGMRPWKQWTNSRERSPAVS